MRARTSVGTAACVFRREPFPHTQRDHEVYSVRTVTHACALQEQLFPPLADRVRMKVLVRESRSDGSAVLQKTRDQGVLSATPPRLRLSSAR